MLDFWWFLQKSRVLIRNDRTQIYQSGLIRFCFDFVWCNLFEYFFHVMEYSSLHSRENVTYISNNAIKTNHPLTKRPVGEHFWTGLLAVGPGNGSTSEHIWTSRGGVHGWGGSQVMSMNRPRFITKGEPFPLNRQTLLFFFHKLILLEGGGSASRERVSGSNGHLPNNHSPSVQTNASENITFPCGR